MRRPGDLQDAVNVTVRPSHDSAHACRSIPWPRKPWATVARSGLRGRSILRDDQIVTDESEPAAPLASRKIFVSYLASLTDSQVAGPIEHACSVVSRAEVITYRLLRSAPRIAT